MLQRRRFGAVSAGRDSRNRFDGEPRAGGHEPKLTRSEARGPEVELLLVALRVAKGRAFVVHAGRGVELLATLEKPNRERDMERGEREVPTLVERIGETLDQRGVLVPAEQPEATLAEADDRIERVPLGIGTASNYSKTG